MCWTPFCENLRAWVGDAGDWPAMIDQMRNGMVRHYVIVSGTR